jgi:hypothetical protein
VLYVDNVRGSNTTGARGNDNLPFATIQGALNAMLTDDLVLLAPQMFTLAAPLTVPASVIRGACYGLVQGTSSLPLSLTPTPGRTAVVPVDGTLAALWDFGATAGLVSFALGCMQLGVANFSPTVADIRADGTSYAAGTFLTGSLFFDNIATFDSAPLAVSAKYVAGVISFENCFLSSGLSFVNCASVELRSSIAWGGAMTISSDAADAKTPAQGRVRVLNGSVVGGFTSGAGTQVVTLGPGQPQLLVDGTSQIGGLKGSGLTASTSPARVPSVVCSGYIARGGNTLDFASAGAELPDTATALVFDFRGAKLFGTASSINANTTSGPTTAQFKVGGAAGNFQTVKMDSITALPGVTFTADVKIHLTMRGSDVPQAVYTTPGADGDITPPVLTGTIDISAGGAGVAKTWVQLGYAGLIRTTAPDTAFLTSSGATADAFIGPAGKTTTGLTISSIISAGNTACNWMAVWK